MSKTAETVKTKKTAEEKWRAISGLDQFFSYAAKNIGETSGSFLRETRAFLVGGEWNEVVRPLLTRWDYGTITAHHCIEEVFKALVKWRSEKGMQQALDNQHRSAWEVNIYEGESVILSKNFDSEKESAGWASRRLCECASECYAILTARNEKTVIRIDRNEAMYRVYGVRRAGQVCKQTSKTTGTLSWGQKKGGGKPAYFSRG